MAHKNRIGITKEMAKKQFFTAATNDNKKPTIGLALQGSGAHGAFTWGVIEGLLDCGVNIQAICGTSSGAFNGALAATGLARNDPELAKKTLRDGWQTVSRSAIGTVFRSTFMEKAMGTWPNLNNPAYNAFKKITDKIPVEYWNITGINPMESVLRRHVDFASIQNARDFKLFVNAVHAKSKRLEIFTNKAITKNVLMASSNLRKIMPPVHINGEEYWDGGFMENPSIEPLAHNTDVSDIIVVMTHPPAIEDVPNKPAAIEQRIKQMLYSSGSYKQLARICRTNDLIDRGALDPVASGERKVNTHLISMPEQKHLDASSQDNLDWEFMTELHDIGYKAAIEWYKKNSKKLGLQSTYDPRDNTNGTVREHGYIHGESDRPGNQDHEEKKKRGLNP